MYVFSSRPFAWFWFGVICLSLITACDVTPPKPCGGDCQPGYVCIENTFCLKSCSEQQTRCNGKCVDLTTDTAHCGKCGTACNNDEYCKDKKCTQGELPPTCDSGLTACGSLCVDLQSSSVHCGACTNACGKNQVCIVGTCADKCTAGQASCNNKCVDLKSDNNNCGGCDRQCTKGFVCQSGKCVCPTGQKECLGVCVDLQSDALNCGNCSIQCGSERDCSGGTCACRSGRSFCSGKCVDTQSNKEHCGQCGQLCNHNEVCQAGKCIIDGCADSFTQCGGKCVDTQTDQDNCGLCGKICGSDQSCQQGQCTCRASTSLCAGVCVDMQTNANHCGQCNTGCTTGEICQGGLCTCQTGQKKCSLPAGQFLCVDLLTDAAHCGQCGNACASGRSCLMGQCVCPPSTAECNGVCVDLLQNDKHCGNCGHQCTTPATCQSGVCSCPTNQNECNNSCVDLQSNLQHCGKCNNLCPSEQLCVAGVCQCNGKLTCGGICVDQNNDALHCGGCNTKCNGTELCIQGKCTCQTPSQVCSNACVNLQKDANHCGKCANACPSGTTCTNFACRQEWAKAVDGNPATGLAVSTDSFGNIYFFGKGVISGNPFSPATFPNYHDGMFLAKLNPQGVYQWAQALPLGAYPVTATKDAAGHVYIIGRGGGTFGSFDTGSSSTFFVAKVNGNGQWLWAKGFSITPEYYFSAISNHLGIIQIGMQVKGSFTFNTTNYVPGGASDAYIFKIDTRDGAFKGILQLHTTGDTDRILGVSVDIQNNLYVSGYFSGKMVIGNTQFTGQSSGSNHDGMVLKLDVSDNLIWHNHLSTQQKAAIVSAWADSSGSVYAVGWFNGAILVSGKAFSTKGNEDMLLITISTAGAVLSTKQFGGTSPEQPRYAAMDANGDLIVAGTFSGNASLGNYQFNSLGKNDVFVAKIITATGDIQWATSGGSDQEEYLLGFDLFGQHFHLAGSSSGKLDFGGPSWPGGLNTKAFYTRNLP